jgi:pilus assembly protein CpaB
MAAAAIVLALVAGIGVYMYASGADKRAEENASLVDAWVANADIAKGTTGDELLQAGLIEKEKVAKSSVPPGAVTDPNSLSGQVLAGPVSAKQFITVGNFVSAKTGFGSAFSNALTSDLVAVTISVDVNRGVANQIAPGDHVNIASSTEGGGYAYILNKVKVLAVGASTATPQPAAPAADGSAPPPANSGVLTFEVSQADALQIINANQGGGLYLVLLPPDQSAPTPGAAKAAASSK